MNTNTVWAVCAISGLGLVLTAFSGPTSAQGASGDDCYVQLSGGEPVEVSGVNLTLASATVDCGNDTAEPLGVSVEEVEAVQNEAIPAPVPTPSVPQTTIITRQFTPGADPALVRTFTEALEAGKTVIFPTVLFQSSSSRLPQEAVVALGSITQAIDTLGGNYLITGYASTDGDRASNQTLSERRAWATAQLLIRNGVPETSISSIGKGETTQFGPARADNRVVTIEPIGS